MWPHCSWDSAQWEVTDGPFCCEFLLQLSEEPIFSRATLPNDAPGLWLAATVLAIDALGVC